MPKCITVKTVDLYLDIKSPHISHPTLDQNNAIAQFIINANIKSLAKDIAKNGLATFNKLSVIIEDDNSGYTVIKGNSRTCAMILLDNPERAPKNQQAFFKKLNGSDKIPSEIEVLLFDKREDCNP